MYVIETRIKTRSNKTIWMPYTRAGKDLPL